MDLRIAGGNLPAILGKVRSNPMNDDSQKKPVGKIMPKSKATDPWRQSRIGAPRAAGPTSAAPKKERIRIELPARPAAG
jgi:hypothetical protein